MIKIIFCADNIDAQRVLEQHRGRLPGADITVQRCATEQELAAALLRLSCRKPSRGEPMFTFMSRTGRRSYPMSQIVYCRSQRHSFEVHLADGGVVPSRTTRCSFPASMAALLESGAFFQCERSVVVNTHYIRSAGDGAILLYDGTSLSYPPARQREAPL